MSTEERGAKMNWMWPQPCLPPIPVAASLLHASWGQGWSVLWMTHRKGSYTSQSCSGSVACILKYHFPLLALGFFCNTLPANLFPITPPPTFISHCVQSLSHVWLFVTSWTVAHQALSVEFSRQEYWSGLPFLSPGDLPSPGVEPPSLASPALAGRFFTTSAFSSKFTPTSPCHTPYSSWSIRFKPISQTFLLLFYHLGSYLLFSLPPPHA